MADYLPAPQFNLQYLAGKTDIGAGYAAGIESAGKSIAGAISGVGDIYKKTQDTNDLLTGLHQAGMLTPDQYEAVMGKSQGAKEQLLGQFMTEHAARLQAQLDQQRQIAIAQATAAAGAPYRMAEIAAQEKGALERQKIASQAKEDVAAAKSQALVVPAPPAGTDTTSSGASAIKSPLQLSLEKNRAARTNNFTLMP
jgi:hypothetical protein